MHVSFVFMFSFFPFLFVQLIAIIIKFVMGTWYLYIYFE